MTRFLPFAVPLRRLLLAALATGMTGGAPAAQAQDAEELAWQFARAEGSIDAYQEYLEQFPLGRYADQAFRSIVELSVDSEIFGGSGIEPGAGVEATQAQPDGSGGMY